MPLLQSMLLSLKKSISKTLSNQPTRRDAKLRFPAWYVMLGIVQNIPAPREWCKAVKVKKLLKIFLKISDMDGIFGGKNLVMNTRDFQWKTWTPMELNMDGWGSNEKYPHALGEPATSINRWYLKMKSSLMPYAYSIAREAVDGKPMIRAMFLEDPNPYTFGKATQYQFMYGPYFLIAPIYQETQMDDKGNDIRDGIYLPEGEWFDYFTGEKYTGGCVVNNFASPLWKLPVFVKAGAIIPMTNPNNNVGEIDKNLRIYELYPSGYSEFVEYDDDGITQAYLNGKGTTTRSIMKRSKHFVKMAD